MSLGLVLALALSLDYLLGEPRRFHPLVGFGKVIDCIEARLNNSDAGRYAGVAGWFLAVLPAVALSAGIDQWLQSFPVAELVWTLAVLYLAIGWKSLITHAREVLMPLAAGDVEAARSAVSKIVSRDTANQDETGIATGAIESVLENGSDAILAVVFWFCILGVPGVVLYRLSNTLDAMWGYRNDRFRNFGWMAARMDDLLNFLPAQLTALTYALLGNTRQAFACWKSQGLTWKSPNAGPVMAAGAGALNVSIGGAESYQGTIQQRPVLGPEHNRGVRPSAQGLAASCDLVNRSIALWLVTIALIEFLL